MIHLLKHRVYTLVILSLLLGSLLGACQPKSQSKQARKITIAQAGDFFLYAPLYVAVDAGLFQKQGLEVSLVSTGGDDKTWAAVLSGNALFGVADPTFVAIADARGTPGRVLASIVNGVPFWGITFVDSIRPISNSQGLRGYSVATFPAPSTAYALQKKMFLDGRLQPSIHEGGFGTILTMLRGGQADIGLELEPNVSQAVQQGAHVVYSLKDVYGDFAITALTTTPEVLQREPDVARGVVCGLQDALNLIHSNSDSTLVLLSKRFPDVDPQVARNALERVTAQGIIPNSVLVSDSAWQKALALRVEAGDVQSPKADSAYLATAFVLEAQNRCN